MIDFVAPSKKLSLQTGIILSLLVLSLWFFLDSQRNNNLKKLTQIRANEISSHIRADIQSRIPAIERIAFRWENRGGTPKTEFLQDANAYIDDLPGLHALGWVDKTFHVRWIAPLKGNEKAVNLNLAFEKNRRITLENARDMKKTTMTPPINLIQGDIGIIIYTPIFINNEFEGFISAVFKIEPWLNFVFSNMATKIKDQFGVNVNINNKQVYNHFHKEKQFVTLKSTSNVHIVDKVISVQIIPTKLFVNKQRTYIPEVVTISGLFLSILISVMVFLLQKTKLATHTAEEANKAKSQFLSSMSHELRTPMNVILGFSELIELDETDNEKKENIKQVIIAGKHLLELINEVLDLSKIESGNIEFIIENHSLNKIIKNSIAMIKPLADKNNIQVKNLTSALPNVTIATDDMRFKQILLNILTNAIKYNSKNGIVKIDYSLKNKKLLILSITDTGKGLSPEQQSNLFKPFERFGKEYTRIEGTGLGLAISKELLELMGGKMGVESNPGKGSRFWLEIPIV